ncbi:hypothetical protein J6590_018429 [Homalodisca vitripennis]|nr:hypothetical protein J6590_018429 [Homalodisca vitripennis]
MLRRERHQLQIINVTTITASAETVPSTQRLSPCAAPTALVLIFTRLVKITSQVSKDTRDHPLMTEYSGWGRLLHKSWFYEKSSGYYFSHYTFEERKASFYSTAPKTLISVSTMVLLYVIVAYHIWRLHSIHRNTLLQASFYSNALKTLISVSTVELPYVNVDYHIWILHSIHRNTLLQASFYSTALKTQISVYTMALLYVIVAYHIWILHSIHRNTLLQASFYSTALKTLISVSTVELPYVIVDYHIWILQSIHRNTLLQASFYSTALKTLISVSTVVLLGLIVAYHALEVQGLFNVNVEFTFLLVQCVTPPSPTLIATL